MVPQTPPPPKNPPAGTAHLLGAPDASKEQTSKCFPGTIPTGDTDIYSLRSDVEWIMRRLLLPDLLLSNPRNQSSLPEHCNHSVITMPEELCLSRNDLMFVIGVY